MATQREQIAALKALGYRNRADRPALPEAGARRWWLGGYLLGVLLGDWLGTMLTGLYAEFFRFPTFDHRIAACAGLDRAWRSWR